jgi:hypothetical protein
MNTKDFLRLGVPLGESTRRASASVSLRRDKTDFVAKFILGGGDTGARTSVRFTVRGIAALEIAEAGGGRELKRRERRAPTGSESTLYV